MSDDLKPWKRKISAFLACVSNGDKEMLTSILKSILKYPKSDCCLLLVIIFVAITEEVFNPLNKFC